MRAMSEQPIHVSPNSHMPQADNLTLRELEVLELLQRGMRNQGIAEHLSISTRTVESHVAQIMDKMGATSRTEAIRTAIETGIIAS
jgi:DNA-binding NarL/FixJ family response regulator